jgi:hypothetical protein
MISDAFKGLFISDMIAADRGGGQARVISIVVSLTGWTKMCAEEFHAGGAKKENQRRKENHSLE